MDNQRDKAEFSKQVENERVIVTEWRFAPGAETGWHRHHYDYVVVPQTSGKLLIESRESETTADLAEGKSYFRKAGVEHNVVNANEYEFVFVEIEIK